MYIFSYPRQAQSSPEASSPLQLSGSYSPDSFLNQNLQKQETEVVYFQSDVHIQFSQFSKFFFTDIKYKLNESH